MGKALVGIRVITCNGMAGLIFGRLAFTGLRAPRLDALADLFNIVYD